MNQQRLLGGALGRMRNFHLSRAWNRWREWFEDYMRQQWLLHGALGRMRNFHLSRAWEQWQYWYEDMMRQKDLLARGLAFLAKNLLARAYRTWNLNPSGPEEPEWTHTRQISRKKWGKITDEVLQNPEALRCVWLESKDGKVKTRL